MKAALLGKVTESSGAPVSMLMLLEVSVKLELRRALAEALLYLVRRPANPLTSFLAVEPVKQMGAGEAEGVAETVVA